MTQYVNSNTVLYKYKENKCIKESLEESRNYENQ
nr:MAG TPA: hypothetical protein [Caudoviricetes sp.]